MKRNGKIAKILIGLMLVTIILSTNATAGLFTNNKSEGLSIFQSKNYMKITLRGRIKDLETNETTISFIPVRVVCILTIRYMGFRHSERTELNESAGKIELPKKDFRCFHTNRMIWGSFYIDLDDPAVVDLKI